jgi:hypothetical protein
VVDASTDYGFAGTLDGLFYKWELVSGRKVASIQCSKSKLHIDLSHFLLYMLASS